MRQRKPPAPRSANEPDPARPGPRDAKGVIAEQILRAARALFATAGYAATSLRSVADAAGVDVALVSYYYKSKAGLLDAVIALPPDYVERLRTMVASTPLPERARATIAFHFAAWEDEATADILRAAVLAAANEPAAMDRIRAGYGALLMVTERGLPEDERVLRAALVGAQFVGLAMMRYIWRIEPIASLPREEVAALIAPVIDHYLRDDLRGGV